MTRLTDARASNNHWLRSVVVLIILARAPFCACVQLRAMCRHAQVGKGQGFTATCKAIKGTGRQHAKWSPVALCVFRQEPIIELNYARLASMSESDKQKCVLTLFLYAAA